jgi:choline kinase
MKAIILSAGQGRRLLPLTEKRPKCLLPVRGDRTLLECQLRVLAASGVEEAVVVVGFGADRVEEQIHSRPVAGLRVRTFFNPFFAHSDNLASVWLARSEFDGDCLLLNGDTLFEPAALVRLLEARAASLTVAIHRKAAYDSDDMKVALDPSGRLEAVSKTLCREDIDAESIGLMRFQGEGVDRFKAAIELAIRSRTGLSDWYLSAIDALAGEMRIETVSINGLWWGEVDSAADLAEVRSTLETQPDPLEGCC